MRSLLDALLSYFLTPGGLFVLGVMDASLVFFLPLGIDVVVVILSARKPEMFWLYALIATAGSVTGAAGTFWIGRKIGEHGLSRIVSPARLKRVERSVSERGAVSIAALAIIPPPFPLTPFVVTSGALRIRQAPFFLTFAAVRMVRFGVEAGLAARYGQRILSWMKSTTFEVIVGILVVLVLAGTIVSAVSLVKRTRRERPSGQAARS